MSSGRALRALALSASLALPLAAPASARADQAEAEALYQAALKLAEKGDFAAACPKYEASYKIDKALGTTLRLADCLERTGKLASAWARWAEALDVATKKGEEARITLARSHKEALEPRLPRLVVKVTKDSKNLRVFRGESPLDPAAYGDAIPIDPGTTLVSVRRDDEVLWKKEVTLAEKEKQEIAVDLLEIEALAPPPKKKKAPGGGGGGNPVVRNVGFAAGAVGLVTLGVSATLLGLSAAKKGEAQCVDKVCTPGGFRTIEDARGLAEGAQWSAIAGGGVLAIGLALVIAGSVGGGSAPPPSDRAKLQVVPWIGPGLGGLAVGGGF